MKPVLAYAEPLVATQQGRSVRLRCQVLWGSPWPDVMWMKNGRRMVSSDRVSHRHRRCRRCRRRRCRRCRRRRCRHLTCVCDCGGYS